MLEDQASQLLGMIDVIAERARKIGGTTIRSVGHVASLQRVLDNDAEFVTPPPLATFRPDFPDDKVLRRRLPRSHESL